MKWDSVRTGTDIAGNFARPGGIWLLSISLAVANLIPPVTDLKMFVVAGAISTLVVVRGMDNRAEAKAAADVKIAETQVTGKPSVGAVAEAGVPVTKPVEPVT